MLNLPGFKYDERTDSYKVCPFCVALWALLITAAIVGYVMWKKNKRGIPVE